MSDQQILIRPHALWSKSKSMGISWELAAAARLGVSPGALLGTKEEICAFRSEG